MCLQAAAWLRAHCRPRSAQEPTSATQPGSAAQQAVGCGQTLTCQGCQVAVLVCAVPRRRVGLTSVNMSHFICVGGGGRLPLQLAASSVVSRRS